MKWKTLITSLLIASSSMATVAVAQPSANDPDVYYRHRRFERNPYYNNNHDRDRDRDRDRPSDEGWDSSRSWYPPSINPYFGNYSGGNYNTASYGQVGPQYGNWQPMVGPVVAANQRQFIHVSPDMSRMNAIRLDVVRGRVYIEAIGVHYIDGSVQKVQVNHWIDARGGSIVFDIQKPGLPLAGLVVYTPGQQRGEYNLSMI